MKELIRLYNRYFHDVVIAVEAILANKVKSMLTALGIMFGVAAVISMLAIGKGAQQEVLEQIKLVGVNNIIVTLANSEGQVISWSSAGKMGFRGSKKNTPYAAQMAAQDCAKVAFDLGLRKVKAYVKGPGNGRESAVRTIHGAGIEVTEIIDVTPLPHNGCRPPKRRRV